MERIKEILSKYTSEDFAIFRSTIETLISKGFSNGAYQDYSMLFDIVLILAICESIVENNIKE